MRRPLVAAIDLQATLLLIFAVLALLAVIQKPTVPSNVQFAVTTSWPAGSNDDVDLYVRDPQGNIVYFADPSVGLMNLEHDDLGTAVSGTQYLPNGQKVRVLYNGERVDLRGFVPGEYTVNVHMYRKTDPGPTRVTVELWSADRVLVHRAVVLRTTGQEETAFRFTLTPRGTVTGVNQVQARLVGGAAQAEIGASVTP